ncbi:hypothetical protein [Microbacterium sp. P5_E9]
MGILHVIAFAPLLLAAGAAAAGWLIIGRRVAVPRGLTRVLIVVATSAALVVMIGYWLVSTAPWLLPSPSIEVVTAMMDLRYLTPLVVGGAALIILAFPVRGSGSRSEGAELSRRTVLTFSRPWWFVTFGIVLLLTVAVAVAAGVASSPDEQGRYTLYVVEVGTAAASTTIYGWHYSVPCLILLAALVGVMTIDLTLISRPAIAENRDEDVAVRRVRSLNVVRVGMGVVLLHLSAVLSSLAGTSTLSAGIGTGAGIAGEINVGTSFAALTPFLYWAGAVVGVIGLALWFSALLSAVPTPNSRRRVAIA